MKKRLSLVIATLCVIALLGCSNNPPSNSPASAPSVSTAAPSSAPAESGTQEPPPAEQDTQTERNAMPSLTLRIGNKNFRATLYDNDSTRALLKKLALTLIMGELNGNEKFYFFSEKLPAASERVGSIKTGDLMLYGSDCLVLFYESFPTSYSYTRLGTVDNVTGWANTLGSGSVEVTFSIN